jgi:hypothetical protein
MKTMSFTLVLFAMLSISCIQPFGACMIGNGNIITENRNIAAFNAVNSEGDYDVYISSDSINEVIVEAPSNVINYIETEVVGEKLIISTKPMRCIQTSEPIKIHIKTTGLNLLELEGSGNIFTNSLHSASLNIELSGSGNIETAVNSQNINATITGSGDIKMSGTSVISDFKVTGSGEIKAFGLMQEKAFATITGSGDIEVFSTTLLDVKITGSGNVYYKGNPQMQIHITGSGSVNNSN